MTYAAVPLQGEIVNSEAAPSSAGTVAAAVLPEEPVSLVVEEKLAVVLNKDGGLESMEVQGTMSLQVSLGPWRLQLVAQSMEVHSSVEVHQHAPARALLCAGCTRLGGAGHG